MKKYRTPAEKQKRHDTIMKILEYVIPIIVSVLVSFITFYL